ncbi:cell surface protein [Streptomyces sp. NPDC054933]
MTDLTPRGIDAAFSVPAISGVPAAVYMVRGSWAVQYDAGSVAPPRRGDELRNLWPKLPAAYLGGIDAACATDTPRVYLFKGSTCVLYDLERNEPVGGSAPVSIGDKFPGLRKEAPAFTEGIDAGLPAPDGSLYFFRGDRCVSYDPDTDEVLDHAAIAEYWRTADHPGAGVDRGVAAAFSHPATSNGYLVAPDGTGYAECDTDRHYVTSGRKMLRDRWPYRTFLSVLDGYDGGLWLFDADSGQRIRQTPVGREPGCVVLAPDGFRALVTLKGSSGGDGSLALLDMTSGAVDTVGAGPGPYRVAVLPDGSAAYVTNPGQRTVHRIDLATGAARPIEVGYRPHGVVAAPGSDLVYVGTGDEPAIAVVDTATHTVIRRIGDWSDTHDMALTSDGTVLGYGVRESNTVAVVRTTSSGEPPHVPVGQSPDQLAASPDSRHLYVTNKGAAVKVIDVTSAREVAPIPVRDRTTAVAVSPDGAHLYITGHGANSVQKLPVTGGEPVDEFPLGQTLGDHLWLAIAPAWG